MGSDATRPTSSHRLSGDRELDVESICCLLHNLIPGGSARQWIHLLGRHVERGGRASILAPPGPLSPIAGEAGIETIDVDWDAPSRRGRRALREAVGRHEVAVVHWDHRVMDAFEPALLACGRAALAVHQAPDALARWFGPQILSEARSPIERALADPHAVAIVAGATHRERVAEAFDLPAAGLRVLPACIPVPPARDRPASAGREVLALTRLSPDKAAIVQLAVELVRLRIDAGHECRLSIAGAGNWKTGALSLCEERLPPDAWRLEAPPRDPIARLAAADLVVAQGLTTLEAAALERRVIVARSVDEERAAGVVLVPDRYDVVARDPFARPPLSPDPERLWQEAMAVPDDELRALRAMVERHNGLEAGAGALREALAATA
jgi:hypothetical protein